MGIIHKILVVEDNVILSGAYKVQLSEAGFEVMVTRSAKQAIEALGEDKFDLVLLDLILQGLSGYEVLEFMKRKKLLAKTPVIIASNLGGREEIEKGLEMGAIDFVIKSDVEMSELIERINQRLSE